MRAKTIEPPNQIASERDVGSPIGASDTGVTLEARALVGKHRRCSIRLRLAYLVLACVLPVWIVAGFLVYRNYQSKRALTEQRMLETARALSMVVDRELSNMQASLRALATSPSLVSGDLPAFYRQALVVQKANPGAYMILADARGQLLINSFLPFGAPLPKRNVPDAVRQVYATGRPLVTNVFHGASSGRLQISVDVPVFRDGQVIYDLAMTIPVDRFVTILLQQHLPPEWLGRIFDSNQVEVARSRLAKDFVGRYAVPVMAQRMRDSAEGTAEAINFEGVPMFNSFSRSASSGWTVVIGVPKAIMMAEIWHWLWWTLAGTALLSLTGIALALPIGRSVEQTERGSRRLSAIVESSDDAIIGYRFDGIIESWNRGAERLFGYSGAEVVGRQISILIPDDQLKDLPELMRRVRNGEAVEQHRTARKHKNGSPIPVALKISPILDRLGTIVGGSEIIRDITERTRAEQQLQATADRLQAILDNAPVGIVVGNRQYRFIEPNAAFQRMVGYSADELKQMDWKALTHPDDIAHNAELVDGLMQGKWKNYELEKRYVLKDGRMIWIRSIGARLDDEHKISIIEDITERKQSAEQLRRSEARLRRLIDSNIVGVIIAGPDGTILDTNNAFLEMVGYAPKDFKNGLGWRDLTPPEHWALDDAATKQADQTGAFRPYEKELIRKNGALFPVIVGGAKTEDREVIVFVLDLTELKKAQLELEQLARIVESADDAIISLSLTGAILSWNQGAERLLGYTKNEMIGASEEILLRADNSQEWEQVREVMAGGKALDYFKTVRIAKSGEEKPVWLRISPIRDGSGRIIGISKIARDRSEAIKAQKFEEQFRQAQKLESLGRLTGGVAHDFNNLLMVISSYTEMLQEKLPPEDSLRRNTQQVLTAAKRAANLTQQLLAFSRKQVLSPQNLDLNAVVDETAKMLKRLIGEDIELTFLTTKPLWSVTADPGQITQVLMNLCVNARDAMPGGGKLTIETRNVVVDAQTAARRPGFLPGDYAMLAVTDTGTGMTKEVQERLFEPFFTTKERGKGTGLGLATVYGIVKQSGGHIWVYSEPNNGSCFKLYFPKVDQSVTTTMHQQFSTIESHGETILVAEDEDSLRESISKYLNERGYIVLKAADGQQALELADHHDGPIHLLLTDVIMPKMSGPELARRLACRPGMVALFMSGYTDDAIVSHGVLQAGTAFVQKPFSLSALGIKVRETLGSAKAAMNSKTPG
jgi:PAS domain S-box-containing protein